MQDVVCILGPVMMVMVGAVLLELVKEEEDLVDLVQSAGSLDFGNKQSQLAKPVSLHGAGLEPGDSLKIKVLFPLFSCNNNIQTPL
jgi:hypothetical protein